MTRVPSKGRCKTQEKRIENEKERAVTFSKRCGGLFKKASEISTLCGVQIAIIIFSLRGKPISFGSPSVNSVVKKFLDPNVEDDDNDIVTKCFKTYNESKLNELYERFDEVNEQLVMERKKGEKLDKQLKKAFGGKTYEEYLESLDVDGLMKLKHKLEDLKASALARIESSSCSSSGDEFEADLSKIEGPKDYLKL